MTAALRPNQYLDHSNVVIRGVKYTSASAAATALGVTAGQVRAADRKGSLDLVGIQRGRRAVTIRGVTYPNFAAAGRALGVGARTIRDAYSRGTLHRAGLGHKGPEPMRVRIAGLVFDDIHAAAAHYGVRPMTVYSAIADGDPDRIVRTPAYNPWNSKPFKIGGLTFPSMRQASRALGFESVNFIAKAIKRGSIRGRERILAGLAAQSSPSKQHP